MKMIITILLSVVLGIPFVILCILTAYSPGKPESFRAVDGSPLPGSLSEKILVNINSSLQGMFIRSKDTTNPVLLYVHGGPGFPNYFLFDKYKPGLDEVFTVCYWEQRGGGLSYSPHIDPATLTYGQLAGDAIKVSEYLIQRFGKDKVYIMAHSGGTPIAIEAVNQAPHLFHAYIGMAQITDQSASEKIAIKYMMEQFDSTGNKKASAELRKFISSDTDSGLIEFFKSVERDKYMHQLGIGTMHNMKSVFRGVFIPVWLCRAYTIKEKFNIWKAKLTLMKNARFVEELFSMDLSESNARFEVPVYLFGGKYDLTVNTGLSKSYFNKINAPVKGFYTFSNSAHSPLFEEPERATEIFVKDILAGGNSLADNLK